MIICLNCKKTSGDKKFKSTNGKNYCSSKCQSIHPGKKCLGCTNFTKSQTGYCSASCRIIAVSHPCLQCEKPTLNPKYCSKSCNTSASNLAHPKIKRKEKFCSKCNKNLGFILATSSSSRMRCDDCKFKRVNWEIQTKAEMRGSGNANMGGRYPMIRQLSRKAYIDSNQKLACKICDYSYHVDICHIHDVKSFPETATISEINHISNLVALCKNHHWEFDHDHLSLDDLEIINALEESGGSPSRRAEL